MSTTAQKHGIAVRIAIVGAFLFALMVPTAAFAQVRAFATAAPGGPGTGGGVGEVWPWGFGIITNQNGGTWGDDSSDTYSMFTPSATSTVSGTTQKYIAWVDKNPTDYEPYIKLRDLTTSTDSTPTYVIKNRNYPTIVGPAFVDSVGTTYTAGANAWFIVLDPGTLTTGHDYQWRFLRGIKANNSMTCVTYTPQGSSELGYIQLNGYYSDYTNPDQLTEYGAKKFDTYQFRRPANGAYEDFTFEFHVN